MSFKSEWVWVPVACLIVFYCLSVAQPACSWGDILAFTNVVQGSEYSRLAVLGCLAVAVVSIARILHKTDDR